MERGGRAVSTPRGAASCRRTLRDRGGSLRRRRRRAPRSERKDCAVGLGGAREPCAALPPVVGSVPMRTLAFFLPLAATGFGCGSHVYYDLERDLDPQGCGEPGYLVIAGTVDGAPVQIYDQFFQATFAPGAIGTSKDSPNDEGVVLVPETQFPCGAMAPDCPNVYGGSTA